jgi:hypothetical protein
MKSSAPSASLGFLRTNKLFVYPLLAVYFVVTVVFSSFLLYMLTSAISSNILDAPILVSSAFFTVFIISAFSMIWASKFLYKRSKILYAAAQSESPIKTSYLFSNILKSISTWLGVVIGFSGTASLWTVAIIFDSYEFMEFLHGFNIAFLAQPFLKGFPAYIYGIQACLAFPVAIYLMVLGAHVCAGVCSLVGANAQHTV